MSGVVRFDCYEVDLDGGQLYKHGVRISLRDKSFQALALLLEHPGQVVTREGLRRRLWPDEVFVDFDNNLNSAIRRLREALGDSADNPRFIETLPKHGYRFLANVSECLSVPKQARARRARLVVLPFVNLSGDPAHEYLGDAVSDEITTNLATQAPEQLGVIARTTAMHYRGRDKDVADIGRELGVDYVVEGGVHRIQDQLTVNVQLIQVRDQTHLFARKYSAEQRDIFRAMDRAASDIADSIGVTSAPDSNQVGAVVRKDLGKPTEDLAVYSDYMHARQSLAKFSAEGFAQARRLLESVLARDPGFAPAYDALAEMYWALGYMGFVPPRHAFSAGITHALRAIEIDCNRAETHALLGQFHKTVEYNWPEVQREMTLALRLDPTSPLVRMRYAWSWLMPHGHMGEAVAEVESALQLDPLSLQGHTMLVILLVISHRHERTLEAARRLLEINQNAYWAYLAIGSTYRDQGELDKAISAHRKAFEASGGSAAMTGWLGLTLAMSSRADEAGALLERLHDMGEKGYVPPTSYAWIHLGLGEVDNAFLWLNRAVDECDQFMMPIMSYRFFDPIRHDPRFQALLRKMNLEP